jgi:two-component system response regulator (stage 0 sporulation protein A)
MLENKLILIGKSSARQIVLADKFKKIGAKSLIRSDDKQVLIDSCFKLSPDVLIVPFLMSNIDAFTLVQEMKSYNKPLPLFIVISDYESEILKRIALELGVIFIVSDDSIFEDMVLRIDNYYRKTFYNVKVKTDDQKSLEFDKSNRNSNNLEGKDDIISKRRYMIENKSKAEKIADISDIIQSTGIPTNIKGYYYLRDAVIVCIENDDKLLSYTRFVCPTVAEKYKVSPSSIDRSIRHAINIAWKSQDRIVSLFSSRPTGFHYITTIAEKFKIGLI